MNKLRHKLINICNTKKKKEKEGKKKKGLRQMEEGRKKEKEIERELAFILLEKMRKLHCFIIYMIQLFSIFKRQCVSNCYNFSSKVTFVVNIYSFSSILHCRQLPFTNDGYQ